MQAVTKSCHAIIGTEDQMRTHNNLWSGLLDPLFRLKSVGLRIPFSLAYAFPELSSVSDYVLFTELTIMRFRVK